MITNKDEKLIIEKYMNGETIIRLAIHYDVSDYRITKVLNKHKIEIRSRGPKRKID